MAAVSIPSASTFACSWHYEHVAEVHTTGTTQMGLSETPDDGVAIHVFRAVSPTHFTRNRAGLDHTEWSSCTRECVSIVGCTDEWIHILCVIHLYCIGLCLIATAGKYTGQCDPMAMLPFCGYHMADYWQHWLDMGEKLEHPPVIANVNWFRTDDEGHFLWPGFGDNLRVIRWVLERAFGEAEAVESEIGYLPRVEDVDISGLDMSRDALAELLSVDKELWRAECEGIREFYARFGDKLPAKLMEELEKLENNLK